MAQLFDHKEKYRTEFTATLADYRRTIEVVYRPDKEETAQLTGELGDSLRNWREIDSAVDRIEDLKEVKRNMECGDNSADEGKCSEDEESADEDFVYTIVERSPLDTASRPWVVYEACAATDHVHHYYSLASLILAKQ